MIISTISTISTASSMRNSRFPKIFRKGKKSVSFARTTRSATSRPATSLAVTVFPAAES